MRKKILSAILVLVMIMSLAACGSKKAAEETTEDQYNTININGAEYVELGEYKNLTIEGAKVEITEEDIDQEMEDLRYQYSEYKKISRKEVKEDDIVNVDYVCKIDGKKVEDYCGDAYDITVGSGELVFGDDLDLETALVGKKVGDTVKVSGTFSNDEIDETVAGKKGEFSIKINYISKEVFPEITDEFVKENFDVNTVEEYRKSVREDLQAQAEMDIEDQNRALLWEQAVKNAKQIKDFPEDLLELEKENIIVQETEWASYFGIDVGDDIESYLQEAYGLTLEEYAKDSLMRYCVLDLIIKAEKIEPTEEEIDAVLQNELEEGGYESMDDVLEYMTRDDVKEQLIYEKVMDVIMSGATIK